ncbi:MAG: hypothetical protein ACLQDV_05805 [Candidatus Binataceae bacterium]
MQNRQTGLMAILIVIAAVMSASSAVAQLPPPTTTRPKVSRAYITSIRKVASSPYLDGRAGVEISIHSDTPFEPFTQPLKMFIGYQTFEHNRHPQDSRNTIVFVISKSSFDSLPDGAEVEVGFANQRGHQWKAGRLFKSLLGSY